MLNEGEGGKEIKKKSKNKCYNLRFLECVYIFMCTLFYFLLFVVPVALAACVADKAKRRNRIIVYNMCSSVRVCG